MDTFELRPLIRDGIKNWNQQKLNEMQFDRTKFEIECKLSRLFYNRVIALN